MLASRGNERATYALPATESRHRHSESFDEAVLPLVIGAIVNLR